METIKNPVSPLVVVVGMAALLSTPAQASLPSFHCGSGIEIVDLLEGGPDHVKSELDYDPEYFVRYLMLDFQCVPEPVSMRRGGRVYLEKIACFAEVDRNDRDATEAEFGEHYREELDDILECFGGRSVSETPEQSDGPRLKSESLYILTNSDHRGHPIELNFGYIFHRRGSRPHYWYFEAGYKPSN